MIVARLFVGTMLSLGAVVVLGTMLLMASDITRLSSQGAAKAQRIVFMGHAH